MNKLIAYLSARVLSLCRLRIHVSVLACLSTEQDVLRRWDEIRFSTQIATNLQSPLPPLDSASHSTRDTNSSVSISYCLSLYLSHYIAISLIASLSLHLSYCICISRLHSGSIIPLVFIITFLFLSWDIAKRCLFIAPFSCMSLLVFAVSVFLMSPSLPMYVFLCMPLFLFLCFLCVRLAIRQRSNESGDRGLSECQRLPRDLTLSDIVAIDRTPAGRGWRSLLARQATNAFSRRPKQRHRW